MLGLGGLSSLELSLDTIFCSYHIPAYNLHEALQGGFLVFLVLLLPKVELGGLFEARV